MACRMSPQKNVRMSSQRISSSNRKNASELKHFENFAIKVPLQSLQIDCFESSQILLNNNRSTATRISDDYCGVNLLLSPDVRADQFIVIQVLETDPTRVGGLRLTIRQVDVLRPNEVQIYADSKCAPQDYLIFWLNEYGETNVTKNNDKKPIRRPLPGRHRNQWELLGDMYGMVVKLRCFVGDRRNAEPFSRIPDNHSVELVAPSISHANEFAGNTAGCLSSISASPSDNTEAFLIYELNGEEIIPNGVEFFQNSSTPDPACAVVPRNNNLEMTSSEDNSTRPVEKSSTDREYATIIDSKLCKICLETEINTVLVPCGHMCLCYECAERVRVRFSSICPICRSDIKQTQKVFLS